MEITLTVIEGPHQGQLFRFGGHDTFVVGRSKQCHFRLPYKDKYFSRVHFLIEVNPPRCRVADMGSRNGTYVNGQKVAAGTDLRAGDLITAGHTVLRIGFAEGSEENTAPTQGGTVALETQKGTGPESPRPPAAPAPPKIAGYEVVRELGRGGMGVVFLARAKGGAEVALKTVIPALAASPVQLERFLREANILRQLEHTHIVRCLDIGEAEGRLYFAMEYVPGIDAGALLRKNGPLPVRTAVGMVAQLLMALEYAHGKQFVHRDIKPSNILLARGEQRGQVKLADFGLARVYQSSQLSGLTMTGDVGGTADFMPPEQITHYRDALPASDQYAAAATLYNLLTGQCVYDLAGEIHHRFAMILTQDPIPIAQRRSDLPGPLAAAIHKALAREPQARFADVKEFRQALMQAV
jgi:serine/threonine-protein kinase